MKRLFYLLLFSLFLSAIGVQAQTKDRFSYFLASDSIYEAADHTYLERDTIDKYGFILLTGEDQFIQITNKPVCVICYDAVADTAFYLYALSVAYNVDETTGEREVLMGEWNPSTSNLAHNRGWKNVKNAQFPYMYLWWSVENQHEEKYYSFSDLVSGMYYVKLEKENMGTSDNPSNALIFFAKMDDLNPLPKEIDYPRVEYYKYTKHTSSSSYGSGYSKYGSLYNYNAFTMMYGLAHGGSSRSSSSTSTYYTWDHYCGMGISKLERLRTGPFNGLYPWMHLDNVYKDNQAIVLYMPNDNTSYGVKKSSDFDNRFDAYWYDLVPFSITEKNFYCPESQPTEEMIMLIDVEKKRMCVIPLSYYKKHWLSWDYETLMLYINLYYVNYEIEGNEGMPMTPEEVKTEIDLYEKLYADHDGAEKAREYAFGDAKMMYDKTLQIIDWFYLHYNEDGHGWLPPMTEEEIKKIIDEYGKYYNDEAGAAELRKYAFGDAGVDDITIDVQDNNPYYNLQGLPVNVDQLEKFKIYIHNGKKYMER